MQERSLGIQTIADQLRYTLTTVTNLRQHPDAMLTHQPREHAWCVKQIIGHLIEEDNRDFVGRISNMIAVAQPLLTINDQDEVARGRNDRQQSTQRLLDEFARTRITSIEFLLGLRTSDLERTGRHPVLGVISVRELIHEWVYHDLNHLSQINRTLQSSLWKDLGAMQGFYR